MKQLILSALLLLAFSACKEEKTTGFKVRYTGLENYEGNTAYLWRLTADGMKSDKDYGKGPIDSAVVTKGEIVFTGKEDTLHLYRIELQGNGVWFYPETGELTFTYTEPSQPRIPVQSTNPRSLNTAFYSLWHEEGLPREKTRQLLFDNIKNAMGCYLLNRWAAVYPTELEELYNRTPEQLRDTVSVLLTIGEQLKATRSLEENDPFIDFRQSTFDGDSVRFSDIAGKGNPVCLLFWLDANETASVKNEMDALKGQYPDVRFVVVTFRHFTPQSEPFLKELKERYQALLINDGRRYTNSARWHYRIYPINFNYEFLFDGQGKLLKSAPL